MTALRDLVNQLKLFCGIQVAMADLIEDHSSRIAVRESEDIKRKAEIDSLKTRLVQLEMVVARMRRTDE